PMTFRAGRKACQWPTCIAELIAGRKVIGLGFETRRYSRFKGFVAAAHRERWPSSPGREHLAWDDFGRSSGGLAGSGPADGKIFAAGALFVQSLNIIVLTGYQRNRRRFL